LERREIVADAGHRTTRADELALALAAPGRQHLMTTAEIEPVDIGFERASESSLVEMLRVAQTGNDQSAVARRHRRATIGCSKRPRLYSIDVPQSTHGFLVPNTDGKGLPLVGESAARVRTPRTYPTK